MSSRPLLISNDADLIDDVLRLAAANGVEIHLANDAAGARSRWSVAPLVLVGADACLSLAGAGLTRRRDVVLVSREPSAQAWQHAVALGAEHVVALPEAERWLIDRLADATEGPARDGRLLAVMGTGAGAGASTFAVTLALAAAARGLRVLVVDGDPVGGGLDILLGLEGRPGIRWPDLVDTRGRLGVESLQSALPSQGGVWLLSWARTGPVSVPIEAISAVLDTATRGFDLVVADVPRYLDAAGELVLSRAHATLLVTSNRVRGVAATARVMSVLDGRCSSVRVVVRDDPKGLDDDAIARVLQAPVLTRLPVAATLPARADDGEPPTLRDAYGRACLSALRDVAGPGEAVA